MVDFTLFNEAFAGRAKQISRCKYCLSDLHLSIECCYAPLEDKGRNFGRSTPQKAVGEDNARQSVQLCMLFNAKGGSNCRYRNCKFGHLCTHCHGGHPASECRQAVSRVQGYKA